MKKTAAKVAIVIAIAVILFSWNNRIFAMESAREANAEQHQTEPTISVLDETVDVETTEPAEKTENGPTHDATETVKPSISDVDNSTGSNKTQNVTNPVVPETDDSVKDPAVSTPVETTPAEPPAETEHVHNYTAQDVVAPNCTTAGHTVYKCSCGDAYNGDETAATAHNYDNGTCRGCGENDPDAETEKQPSTEDVEAPVEESKNVCGDNCQHAEIVVGCYTYVYCSSVTSPYKSADGYTIYYPYDFYF